MNKTLIRLTESELHDMIMESVKGVLTENNMAIKNLYYQLRDTLDNFIEALYNEGYAGEGCDEGNELVARLSSTREAIEDYFRHPDVGGSKTIFDSVGF